jgi:hypothetical protein
MMAFDMAGIEAKGNIAERSYKEIESELCRRARYTTTSYYRHRIGWFENGKGKRVACTYQMNDINQSREMYLEMGIWTLASL